MTSGGALPRLSLSVYWSHHKRRRPGVDMDIGLQVRRPLISPYQRIGCSLRDWVALDKHVKTDVSRYTEYTRRKRDRHQEWWWWCRCSSTLSFPKRPSDPLAPQHALALGICSHHAWPRLCSPVLPLLSRAQSGTHNFFLQSPTALNRPC